MDRIILREIIFYSSFSNFEDKKTGEEERVKWAQKNMQLLKVKYAIFYVFVFFFEKGIKMHF